MMLAGYRTASKPPLAPAAPTGAELAEQAEPRNSDEPSKALPADFPGTMPIYPGAKLEHVRKPKGSMREILFSTRGQLEEMVDFYKQGLAKRGYEITASLKMPARKTWSCDFHQGGQQASVMLFPSDQDNSLTTIDLIYEIPRKVPPEMQPVVEEFDVIGPGEVAAQTPTQKPKRN